MQHFKVNNKPKKKILQYKGCQTMQIAYEKVG